MIDDLQLIWSILAESFGKRNIFAHFAETGDDAKRLVLEELIPKGEVVGCGGSSTTRDTGIIKALSRGDYALYDRHDVPKKTPASRALALAAQHAIYFVTGINAVTLDGHLIAIDREGNRASALIYGPKYVIVVAGKNKVVPTKQDGYWRARNIAAAANVVRKGGKTPCAKALTDALGIPLGEKRILTPAELRSLPPDYYKANHCTDCGSPDRMCYTAVELSYQPIGRMHLVMVNKDLGF